MKKVRLYVNTTKEIALYKAYKIREELQQQGYEITDKEADIVIGVGGDGTLFHFLRDEEYNVNARYIGINCGTLGFLQDFDAENVEEFVKHIPQYVTQRLNFVALELEYNGKVRKFYALNEFSIHHCEYKSFKSNVRIDDNFLENYVGTGIIFSTATGSTALGLSAGGAILHPSIKAIQMTPREAIVNSKMHSLSKSICLPKGIEVILTPSKGSRHISIDGDGEEVYNGPYDRLKISYSERGITKLKNKQDGFVRTIKEKLI